MENLIDHYLTIKFLFGQGNNHLSLISDVAKNMMIGVMFLRVLGWDKLFNNRRVYWTLVALLGVVYVCGVIFTGYLAVKFKVLEKENTLSQSQNAELQNLLQRVE